MANSKMQKSQAIAVIGAGHGGLAMAGHLALMGHKVNLYNRSEERLWGVKSSGTIEVTGSVFLLRWLFIEIILRMPPSPLVFFAPRGLITILLFLNIPAAARIPFLSEEVVTLVILMSIAVLTAGNMIYRPESEKIQPAVMPEGSQLPDGQTVDDRDISAVNNSGGSITIINEEKTTTSDS